MNIIVKDKTKIDTEKIKKQLDKWLKVDYAHIHGAFELQYHNITRKIIVEKFITEIDGNLHDYKIHCFNGEPKYIQLIGNRTLEKHTGYEMFYTTAWERSGITATYPAYANDFPKPKELELLLAIAKCLSKSFAYVRVDLYVLDDGVYFGEMTFSPGAGALFFNPPEADRQIGEMLVLPTKQSL